MTEPIITVAEARTFAHDEESTDAEMQDFIFLAEKYMAAAVGNYTPTDPRVRYLVKLLVCDFDNVRSTTAKESNMRRMLVQSLILQLQTEPVSILDTATEEVPADA